MVFSEIKKTDQILKESISNVVRFPRDYIIHGLILKYQFIYKIYITVQKL